MGESVLFIADTNIWIDLAVRPQWIPRVFQCGFDLAVPDFVAAELSTLDCAEWQQYGLTIYSLTPAQVTDLHRVAVDHRRLSIADLAAFILARDEQAGLLTGDGPLRRFVQQQNITVHGVLWLLDQIEHQALLGHSDLAQWLAAMKNQGARLPVEECEQRMVRWAHP